MPAPGAGGGVAPRPCVSPACEPGLHPAPAALARGPGLGAGQWAFTCEATEREPGAGARGGERTGALEGDGNGAPGQHRGDAEAGDGRQRGPVHLRR